ncbi:hypothetical protein A3K63_04590 [Candidatus Micrarchaeota archaeon RBG_16_49_10]|nr:MAG: hypothetical protein A3K63_04590 [Candidatus Micrarchaeota archaeon RBG_16_49_10]
MQDNITKLIVSIIIGLVIYLVVYFPLNLVFAPQPQTMMDMMRNMGSNNLQAQTINVVSIAISLMAVLFVYSKLNRPVVKPKPKQRDELSILKRALSEDEKKVISEIEKAEKITQDSLRFRLSWSKAKLSAILTRLDRMRIIQRERVGKTYNLFLEKKKR